MSEEQVVSTNTEVDPEFRKPNPQDNPRNIVLAEIAASVAEKHGVEDKETFPSMDEEGNITPATPPEAVPSASELAPDTPAPEATPVPSEPVVAAPVVPPSAVVPDQDYEVVVDGQKMKVKGQAIIDAGYRTFQKETAADFRLKMASELLREAEAKVRGPAPAAAPEPAAPADKTDAELSNAMQFGTPEQSAEAIKVLRSRGMNPEQMARMVASQARVAAQDELQFQDAMKFVESEYSDLLSNDYMKRMFFVEENRRRAPRERGGEADSRPYKELYKSIGEDLRTAFKLPKAAASSPAAPIPTGTVAARQALKAATPPVPRTAATRLSEAAAATKVPTPSEIIARMAETRGKTHLTTLRKGT